MQHYYYIFREGEKEGPFSIEQLRGQDLNHDTMLWQEGMEEWMPASSFHELRVFIAPGFPSSKKSSFAKPVFITMTVFCSLIGIIYIISSFHSTNVQETHMEELEYEQQLERQKEIKIEFEKKYAREHIEELVHLSRSDYTVKFWGGISGLKIHVENISEHVMDIVVVEVRYIKSDGGIFKTENINFTNVKPHTNVFQYAPESKRGSKVDCKIALIKSAEIDL